MISTTDLYLPGFSGEPPATEPTLSVAGVTDGEVATITAGARSLSITAQSGSTLLTTVNDKDGAVTVTGSTTATPSWTAPSGGTTGNACQVHVTATLNGLVSEVSRTELVGGSGGGAASWADLRTVTMSEAATAGPWTSGTNTVTDSGGDSVDIITTRVGANTGSVSVTNTVGLVITAVGGNSLIAGADVSGIFSAESKDLAEPGAYVIDAVLQMTSLSTAGYIIAVNSTNDVTGSDLRGIRIISDGAGGYIVKAREGSTESAAIATGADDTVDLAVAIVVSDGGASVRVKVAEQSTPIADPWTGSSRVGTDAISSLGTQPYDTTSRGMFAALFDDVLTVPLFGIRRYA